MASASVRTWRRGPAPRAAGPHDWGYFGPESVVWRVATHPATALVAGQVTFLFEFAHRDMQAVMLGHDPAVRASLAGGGHSRQFVSRGQRTVGVPVPILLGDTSTADGVAAHLRRMHARMSGTVPGTAGEHYAAGSPELVVFAHVTIAHAFLRTYEALAYHDGHGPARLPDAERDRYFREFVPLATLMGAPAELVPDSASAVADYYASIADRYETLPEWQAALPKLGIASMRPARLRGLFSTPGALWYDATLVAAFSIVPRSVRRLYGIPHQLDLVLERGRDAVRAAFAPLAMPGVGDRAMAGVIGPENLELVRAARRSMATPARAGDEQLVAA